MSMNLPDCDGLDGCVLAHLGHGCQTYGIDRYILAGQTPVQEPCLLRWAAYMETAERHVAQTVLADGTRVSTVFVGIDYNWLHDGPPLLFETKVFRDGVGGEWAHYTTWAEAAAGHAAMCFSVQLDADLAVTCGRCGAEGLSVFYQGRTWGETYCETCYATRRT